MAVAAAASSAMAFLVPSSLSRIRTSFPLISASPDITLDAQGYKLLEDILKHALIHMHGIQRNLQYWSAIAEGSDVRYKGVQFKLKETIPLNPQGGGPVKFQPVYTDKGIPPSVLTKICVLMSVRYHLSIFISKVREELMSAWKSNSSPAIATVKGYILGLKDSVHSVEGISHLCPLTFAEDEPVSGDTVNGVYVNLYNMDMYIASLIANSRRPRYILQNWMPITAGAIAVALSLWVIKENGPMGVIDHLNEQLTYIKDELFNKSLKRQTELMEREEVRFTNEALNRMFVDYIEQNTDQKCYRDEPNKLVAERYAEQIKAPIRGILRGDLVQNCFVQIQKLKLDYLTEKLFVNNMIRANGLTFAIVAALPTMTVLYLGVWFIYKLVKRSKRKRGIARRRLLQQIEWRLNELKRQDDHEEYMHGLLVYVLDQLYHVTERPAKATCEWESIREEITSLGMKAGDEADSIISRLKANYACLRF